MFRKMIDCESLKYFQKSLELNLARHFKSTQVPLKVARL